MVFGLGTLAAISPLLTGFVFRLVVLAPAERDLGATYLNLLLWGFLSLYLQKLGPKLPAVIPIFLGALILWDVLFRSQIGVAMAFLEEVWSRNLANLFVTPLTELEFVLAQVAIGLLRVALAVGVVSGLAALLYGFNLFSLANNHAMDYGAAGLRETLKSMDALAEARSLVHAGAGRRRDEATRAATIAVKGVRVAFSDISKQSDNRSLITDD